jgi:hypothetical protein
MSRLAKLKLAAGIRLELLARSSVHPWPKNQNKNREFVDFDAN